KPCPPPVLADAIRSGVRQYNLINSEKELLQHTLSGSIKLLTDLLAKAHPIAYGRAARLRGLVGRMAHALDSGNSWLLEMATMLSQVGCMGVPENILARAYHGESLSPEQERLFHSHPAMGRALLENLPRLREVAEIVGCQEKRFDGKGLPSGGPVGKEIPLGARILKIVLDYDTLEQSSRKADEIILELSKRAGWYDLDLLQVLVSVLEENPPARVHSVRVIDLTSSALLAEDLVTTTGLKILNKNQEITPAVCVALRKLMETGFSFREPIRIAMPHDQ
ncbi:two-component system response regulator, partial [bacterium]|nr:two-component system response regulator [bacterium]